MSGPLAGIRVIDLTSAVLGQVTTQILGDMGADVIKVETPGGDAVRLLGPARHPGMGAYFLNISRNKRSVELEALDGEELASIVTDPGVAVSHGPDRRVGSSKRAE
jgi:crotonobetainyl-CoA:carnitine CoA-transferase CaiB-like acyl-CoA transferase